MVALAGVEAALAAFGVVFGVVLGFELVDRTNFSLIALAARRSALRTWIGGSLAFVLTSGIAVTLGAAIVSLLGPDRLGWVRVGGGAFLVGYAVWFSLEKEESAAGTAARSALVAAFLATFLLELGDTTMILETLFVASYGPWIVFFAGSAALIVAAAWGSYLGSRLGARVEPSLLKRIVVGVLITVGALTILYGLAPGWFGFLG